MKSQRDSKSNILQDQKGRGKCQYKYIWEVKQLGENFRNISTYISIYIEIQMALEIATIISEHVINHLKGKEKEEEEEEEKKRQVQKKKPLLQKGEREKAESENK